MLKSVVLFALTVYASTPVFEDADFYIYAPYSGPCIACDLAFNSLGKGKCAKVATVTRDPLIAHWKAVDLPIGPRRWADLQHLNAPTRRFEPFQDGSRH